ncbi:MAG: glycosyltransferase family 4 protein [Candidatus Zixiibacteriota bacterium]
MRILYLTQYFPPEIGAGENRAFEMAKNLQRLGHKITVITEFPNYPSGIVSRKYRFKLFEKRKLEGIEVIRTYVKAAPERSFKNRILFYLSFMFTSILAGLKLHRKFDLIYATSPPLFVGLAGYLISRIKKINFVFEVRDIWPDAPIVLGELKNKIVIELSKRVESLCYKKARKVITVSRGWSLLLQDKGVPPEKIEVVYNGADPGLFRYAIDSEGPKEELGYKGKFLALYFGTMGLAHGVDLLVKVAELLKEKKDIKFLMVGNGPHLDKIKKLKELNKLSNLDIQKEKPREVLIKMIAAADVCLVPVRQRELFKSVLPLKMFEAWACGRPIVLSVDGEAREHLERARAGAWVEPENVRGIKDAILFLYNHPELRKEFGRNGRFYVERYFSRKIQAERLEKILVKILQDG